MFYYIGLVSLIFAVSIDSLAVGITYGLRGIRLPFAALLVIMLCSFFTVSIAMLIGLFSRMLVPTLFLKIVASLVLIILGIFLLIKLYVEQKQQRKAQNIFTTVLYEPERADRDNSGAISFSEAIVLGTVLALDATGAGLAASILGYSITVTATGIALMSGVFLYVGIKAGNLFAKNPYVKRLSILPPLILITLGWYSLFH